MFPMAPRSTLLSRRKAHWAGKREGCWDRMQTSDIELSAQFLATLVPETRVVRRREDWRTKATLLWHSGAWKRLNEWSQRAAILTEGESELVGWATITPQFRPRGLRLIKLKEAWDRVAEHGFV